jgi:predicted ATP-binding protein involved in virulence
MRINHIRIKNFRGCTDLEAHLNPNFNLFIGDNGSGKTAVLEALTVAISSFFLGIRGANARGIHQKDIRIATFQHSEEYQFPVEVEAEGIVHQMPVSWLRTLETNTAEDRKKNRTTTKYAAAIKKIASDIDHAVRMGENVNLPLLVYYATGRLFDEARDTDALLKEKQDKMQISSRFRVYERSLEAKSTYKKFQKWFKNKEISRIQKGGRDVSLEVVKSAIMKSLPDCKNIYHEFDPDRPQGLKIELEDGRILPFGSLSDGTRNFFAIVADMAYMCMTLNPHLEERALEETEGVVLIDELDLHLHPAWQRKIIKVLREAFPKVQFIATTHSPFLIQETGEGQLIILKNSNIHKITGAANLSIEDIAEELQYVENPQWGKLRQEMFEKAKVYYQAVKEGKDTPAMKVALDAAMKPFALDTAFYAIVEQEKMIQEHNRNKK